MKHLFPTGGFLRAVSPAPAARRFFPWPHTAKRRATPPRRRMTKGHANLRAKAFVTGLRVPLRLLLILCLVAPTQAAPLGEVGKRAATATAAAITAFAGAAVGLLATGLGRKRSAASLTEQAVEHGVVKAEVVGEASASSEVASSQRDAFEHLVVVYRLQKARVERDQAEAVAGVKADAAPRRAPLPGFRMSNHLPVPPGELKRKRRGGRMSHNQQMLLQRVKYKAKKLAQHDPALFGAAAAKAFGIRPSLKHRGAQVRDRPSRRAAALRLPRVRARQHPEVDQRCGQRVVEHDPRQAQAGVNN